MAQNKKQSAKHAEAQSLPTGIGAALFLLAAVVSLGSTISYSPTDLPLTPLKFLREFAPHSEPVLPRSNLFGPIGAFLGFFQLQLFGAAAFLGPIGLFFFAIHRLVTKKSETRLMQVGLLLLVLCGSAFLGCCDDLLFDWSTRSALSGAGGVFGQLIGESIFERLLAPVGAIFVIGTAYLLGLISLFNYQPAAFFGALWEALQEGGRALASFFSELKNRKREEKKSLSERLKQSVSTPPSRGEEKKKRSSPTPPLTPTKQEAQIPLSPVASSGSIPQIIDGTSQKRGLAQVPTEKPFTKKEPSHGGLTTDGFENYELPGYELLNFESEEQPSETNREELLATQRVIIETLKSFGVEVTPGDITRGPTITRFEVYPALGLKVSRITALEADLARVTKAEAINILAPIPGKDTVGIEVANSDRVLVSFSEILLDDEFRGSKRKIPLALGKKRLR